ncbi:hypothetical protein [Paenibacillus wynnii]|uniref:Uncharacterized protein n=1 Tax=Paenibacillus wynnii TaxID=268407 RepID=A0A098M7N0_9BACL|nr:hypothetical protein [Paenibacillus wynnii]KGE17552.1 hypothetical protein PWYN_23415 [Paenibacillus wynnii]
MNFDWSVVISAVTVSAVINAGVQLYIKSKGEKSLENHKQKLNVHTENLKFDLQKKIHDYSLYSVKRHEIYPQLFKLLLIAEGNIRSLFGFRRVLTFEEFNKADIKIFMEGREVVEGKQELILSLWDNQKNNAIEELKAYLKVLDIQDARKSLVEAKNYLLFSELFLSENVALKSDEVFQSLAMILAYSEFPTPGDYRERDQLNSGLNEVIAELNKQMKKDLSDI